jgi:flagellar motor switch protein FliG
MDGVQRAAILLLGMGEKNASEVIKHLEPRHVQKVGMMMSNLANVSKVEMQEVLNEFLGEAEQQTSITVDSEDYIRNVLTDALGEENATSFIDRILTSDKDSGLNKLKWLDARVVADVIRNEHPQIIATILTYLDSEQAAEVVNYLNKDKRVEVLVRMCSIDTIKPEAISELGSIIEEQLSGHKVGKTASIGGITSVANVINYLDGGVESEVLENIMKLDEDLCEKIQDKMFVFENLVDVDGRSIQTLLREVSTENLMLALKGTTEKVREKILSNMSKRAAELLKDDLDSQGPVKVSEVEDAQKIILNAARKLAEEGKISLGTKGGEEMI